jgi:hypothetical protein
LVGVAVNVTEPPVQIEVVLAAIDTDGITVVVVMPTELLVAIKGLAQGSLLVITTAIILPFARVDEVKADAVCPATFTPFIIH